MGIAWASVLCPSAFVIFLLFWQRFQQLVGLTPHFLFIDKHCIKQDEPELKARGIYGLAGFLLRSERLVLLWSPRYFTRLWCTFELAAWHFLEKLLGKVS